MFKILLFILGLITVVIIGLIFYFAGSRILLFDKDTINFSSLSLNQKIAQMIIVRGDDGINLETTKLDIGGIFIDRQKTEKDYFLLIKKYQDRSKIKLLVTTDMEGAWNPFTIFKQFSSFSGINTSKEAYEEGLNEGILMKKLGFNLNFAPVSEFNDKAYGGRAFLGNESEVKLKLESYIKGLQKNVCGTCKHYPGKGMINNLHLGNDKENISNKDLELFDVCLENNISSIMIGHQVVYGAIDSNGKPSSVSPEVISSLENFSGLIISDEINMLGLKNMYKNKVELYKDLINSGENVILDFDLNTKSSKELIDSIANEVKQGRINESNIDKSVKKILIFKGYKVVY